MKKRVIFLHIQIIYLERNDTKIDYFKKIYFVDCFYKILGNHSINFIKVVGANNNSPLKDYLVD